MRKILSCIITIAILAGIFCVPVNASSDISSAQAYKPDIAEETLMGLGVISSDGYDPDAHVSRADFAVAISSLCGFVPNNKIYNDAMDYTYGNDANNILITSDSEQIFTDVDKTMPEYNAINAMCLNGYMNGISATHFAPYYDMTLEQVIKVIVSMLGYDTLAQYEGGYPTGYMNVAGRFKLTNGINTSDSRYITYNTLCNIIYNAFDVNVCEVSSIGADGFVEYTKSEKTFLNECAGIYKITGTMTDNGISTFYGNSDVGAEYVVVDKIKMAVGSYPSLRSYLGRYADVYYTENKAGRKTLRYITATEGDNAVNFDIDDFGSYTSGSISYYTENGKKVTKKLASNLKVIYNFDVLKSYDAQIFDFLYGDVTLSCSDSGSTYDVLIINDYMVGKVKKKDAARSLVYTETLYTNMNSVKTIDLSEESDKVVIITDANGTAINYDAITPGSVVSVMKSSDGSFVELKVCDSQVKSFTVQALAVSDVYEISDGNVAYTLKGVDHLDSSFSIRTGDVYDLYFDYKGNLIWVENLADSTDLEMGILLDAEVTGSGFDDGYAVKIYTKDGIFGIYNFKNKLILNHDTVDAKVAFNALTSDKYINDTVLYRVDEEGALKALVLPLSYGEQDTDNRGWYEVSPQVRLSRYEGESDSDWLTYFESEDVVKYVRSEQGNSLNRFMMYDKANSTVFTVPSKAENFNDEKKFSVNVMTPRSNVLQLINMYDKEQDTIAPKALIMSASGGADGGDVVNTRGYLITKISKSVDEDGEDVTLLSGYIMDLYASNVSSANLILDNEVVFIGEYGGRDGKYAEGHDKYDDDFPVLDNTEPEHDFELDGPASPEELQVGDIIRYDTNEEGNVSRIRMVYDLSEDKTYNSGKEIKTDSWTHQFKYGYTFGGYPLSTQGGKYVRLCADEPHTVDTTDVTYMMDSSKVVVHEVNLKTLIVEEVRGGVSVKVGSIEDIVSYNDSGDLASGEYNKVVAIAYMAMPIGTVVYK